jgi:glucosyl-dolichyl phosphate glucuronosyltransferase
MKASVIISTRNRVDSLFETLDSLLAMDVPKEIDWELVIIDNASTDGTAQRVRDRRPPTDVAALVVLEEPTPGKSYALNRAIKAARGEFLLFTDDDALVDPHWLTRMLASFEEHQADCIGGKVVPCWLASRPSWLSDRLINVLAMLDLGPEPQQLREGDPALYGVNYAFRRDVFSRVGDFDTGPNARVWNEDYDMMHRVQIAGGRVFYDPRVVVRHKVFPERLTRAYFRRWHRFWGRDRAETMFAGRHRVLGLEGYMLRNFCGTLGRLAWAAVRFDSDECFYEELRTRLYLAYIHRRLSQLFSGRLPEPQPAPVVLRGDRAQ